MTCDYPSQTLDTRSAPGTLGGRRVGWSRRRRGSVAAGTFDDTTDWSDAAPSADDGNKEIDRESFDKFAEWHLGVNPDASEGTKGRFAFPYGDFAKVNRAALIHAKQRASQNDHNEIEKAAADLLQRLDSKRS